MMKKKLAAAVCACSVLLLGGMAFGAENETTLYAQSNLNVRSGPGTDYPIIETIDKGDKVTTNEAAQRESPSEGRVWIKVTTEDGKEGYCAYDYLASEEKHVADEKEKTAGYPKTAKEDDLTVTVSKEWYENAWVYAAKIEYEDGSHIFTKASHDAYGSEFVTVADEYADTDGAILMTNDDWSSYAGRGYSTIRQGKVENPGTFTGQAGWNAHSGLLLDMTSYVGTDVQTLVDKNIVTDTFYFNPVLLRDGEYTGVNDNTRAQRTFIGQGDKAGTLWLCVSDGRLNDGDSDGLTFEQEAEYLKSKGCTRGFNLDGGGSTTMVFQGEVLNAIYGTSEGPRAVSDYVVVK